MIENLLKNKLNKCVEKQQEIAYKSSKFWVLIAGGEPCRSSYSKIKEGQS